MLFAFRRHPVLTTAFALAALLALVFAANVVWRIIYWEFHEDEPIESWMTVGYIGRSWDLNPRLIDEVADLPTPEEAGGRPQTLAETARRRGVPVEEVIAEVEAALAQLKARQDEGRGPPGDGDRPGD
jgi:hypothetical protein